MKKTSLLKHYGRLLFYTFHRHEGKNYAEMRNYFTTILIEEIEEFMKLKGKKILDVGGSKGEFCATLSKLRNCDATNLEPFTKNPIWKKTVRGLGYDMPFKDNVFHLSICRGVIEHIPKKYQQGTINEMYRVTKKGGYAYILVPPYYSPHGGHTVRPFHYFPFKIAKFLKTTLTSRAVPQNSLEDIPLYITTFSEVQKMITYAGFKIVARKDTHFRLHFLTRIPILREFLVQSAVFIAKK